MPNQINSVANENIKFSNDQNNLSFHYRGLSFIDEKKNLFHIRLKNLDNDWQDYTTTNESWIKYTNLSPGEYLLSLNIENFKGVVSDTIKSAIFEIDQPFYKKTWMLLLATFVIGYLVFVFEKSRKENLVSSVFE